MRIAVNLDTHEITSTPSALKFKTASLEPVTLVFAFTGASPVLLPANAVIELALINQGTALAYTNVFSPAAGNAYTGFLACSGESLIALLTATNPSKLTAEVKWSIGSQSFRSQTFTVQVEKAEIPDGAEPSPDPSLYPPVADLLTQSKSVANQEEVNAGIDDSKVVTPATLATRLAAFSPGAGTSAAYTLQSTAFTAVAGGQYALDTTVGGFAVTIDAALPVGKYIDFADASGTWNTNPPIFLRNGHLMEGVETDYADAAQGTFLRILNVGGAKGLRILESGTKPHNLVASTITGQYVGQTFIVTTGSWTGSPTSFLYQAQSSPDLATWTDISGATANTYTPGAGLLGYYIRFLVSAANANGTSLPTPSAASAALTAAPYPAGAVAALHLDETSGTRVDATGNGNDLTDTNGVENCAGVLGTASYFDPNKTAYLGGAVAGLTGSFSISGWVKLVSESQNVPGPASVFQLADGQGGLSSIRLQWGDGHGGFNIQNSSLGSSDSGLSDSAFVWGSADYHNFVCTYDNSVEGQCACNVYIDGNIVPSAMVVFAANFVPNSLILGAQINDNWQVFGDCAVDEVVIFSRLLSAADAAALYNNGQGLAYSA